MRIRLNSQEKVIEKERVNMVMDYLQFLVGSGFEVPKKEIEYDDRSMTQTYDQRGQEVKIAIRVALRGMSYKGNHDGCLHFMSKDKKEYLVTVTKNSITCTMDRVKTDGNLEGQREFKIYADEEGNYFFERMLVSEKGIVAQTFCFPKPSYNSSSVSATINGYDCDTMELFKESIPKDFEGSYMSAFSAFIQCNGILPDLSRKVSANNGNYRVFFKEDDLISEDNIGGFNDITISSSSSSSLFIALESFIRFRNYSDELEKLCGLPYTLEGEIQKALLLKKPETPRYR